MKFEVRRGAIVIMRTYQDSCIPAKAERDMLREAGYKLYLDGKLYVEKRRDKLKPSSRGDMQEEQMEGQLTFWNERECAVE